MGCDGWVAMERPGVGGHVYIEKELMTVLILI